MRKKQVCHYLVQTWYKCLLVKQSIIPAGRHFINQTVNLLELKEVVVLLSQQCTFSTDKANQCAYHQSGCVTSKKHMESLARIKQGKGEMFPLKSLHTNLSLALTHKDGRAVRRCMSTIHGKSEIRLVNHRKAAQKLLIKLH